MTESNFSVILSIDFRRQSDGVSILLTMVENSQLRYMTSWSMGCCPGLQNQTWIPSCGTDLKLNQRTTGACMSALVVNMAQTRITWEGNLTPHWVGLWACLWRIILIKLMWAAWFPRQWVPNRKNMRTYALISLCLQSLSWLPVITACNSEPKNSEPH